MANILFEDTIIMSKYYINLDVSCDIFEVINQANKIIRRGNHIPILLTYFHELKELEMSTNTCYICMMKFSIIFSSLAYSFVKFNCQHTRNPSRKPLVRCAPARQLLCNFLLISVYILGLLELYFTLKEEDVANDNATMLNTLELVTTLGIIKTLFIANIHWKEKIREIKVMIYISEYLKKFPVEDNFYTVNYIVSVCWAAYSVLYYGSQFLLYWLNEPVNHLLYLKSINKLVFGKFIQIIISGMHQNIIIIIN